MDDPSIETLLGPDYWRQLCPELSVDGQLIDSEPLGTIDAGPGRSLDALKKQLDHDGYYVLPALDWGVDLDKVRVPQTPLYRSMPE